MGTPATTAPGTPEGLKMDDGFAACISFALAPNFSVWEIETQPPGLDGGDEIDTTTHRNKKARTSAPRKLISVGETTHTVRFNKKSYEQAKGTLINKNGAITEWYPDGVPTSTESGLGLGSSCSYFGYLKQFDIKPFKEGEPPEADITIVVTNTDPADGSEQLPVMSEV